jgi:hypothetical protein
LRQPSLGTKFFSQPLCSFPSFYLPQFYHPPQFISTIPSLPSRYL